jgi:hypothetical protein
LTLDRFGNRFKKLKIQKKIDKFCYSGLKGKMSFLSDQKKLYFSIEKVFNPHFKEDVVFDIQGWNHLMKQGNGAKREFKEVSPRLSSLGLIKKLLMENISPQEYSKRIYSDNFEVRFYGFIYAIRKEDSEEFRLKIVVRQKTGQPKKFYSLIKMKHKHFQNKETS